MFGHAKLEPAGPVVAGTVGTWKLTYTVGSLGLDDGGTLKVAWRFATDWGRPQFSDPAAPDYASFSTTGPASLRARFDPKGHVRPWQKCLVLDVFDDGLRPGDVIELVYGDTSGGSPGSRAQTFCEHTFEFRVLVDCHGTGEFVRLDSSPEIEIVSGPAANLVLLTPTAGVVGEPSWLGVKLEDAWGNPARSFEGVVNLSSRRGAEGLPRRVVFTPQHRGVQRLCFTPTAQGVIQLVADAGNLHAVSNPCVVVPDPPAYRPYWGDLHGQSEGTVGTNTVADYFAFARDSALLDCCSHQANDFQVTDKLWDEICNATVHFDQPGRFVTLLGYEWSANTGCGGDHNVYFRYDWKPIHRCSQWQIRPERVGESDRTPLDRLYATLRNHDALTVPHVGGRRANLEWHDEQIEPLVEIYSAWGCFEWLFEEALQRGYHVGVIAGSDGHKGRPGASYPGPGQFGVYGGLVCIYARELTRASLWEALRARRCVATTGQRLHLWVEANGHPMGAIAAISGAPEITVRAVGTTGLERIELRRGLETVYTHLPLADRPRSRTRLRVSWSGARILGRDRATRWDGRLTLENGTIRSATGWAFDSPDEGLIPADPGSSVAWTSITTGDEDGVVLDIDAADNAVLRFETAPATFRLPLADLGDEPFLFDAGGIRRQVVVERLWDEALPAEVEFTYADQTAPAGEHAYWVRLFQEDGARAWSSPIFLTVPPQ